MHGVGFSRVKARLDVLLAVGLAADHTINSWTIYAPKIEWHPLVHGVRRVSYSSTSGHDCYYSTAAVCCCRLEDHASHSIYNYSMSRNNNTITRAKEKRHAAQRVD